MYCYIEANNSVLVGQFPYSPIDNTDGDTTMIMVASTDQYSNSFTFWTPDTEINNHISIMIPVKHYDLNNVIYDGRPLNCIEAIYDNDNKSIVGYGCSLSVSTGLHSIYHVNQAGRLFVMVYGFISKGAYGYPAGLTFDSSKGSELSYDYLLIFSYIIIFSAGIKILTRPICFVNNGTIGSSSGKDYHLATLASTV